MMMNVLLSKIIDDHIRATNQPPNVLKLYPAMVEMLTHEYMMIQVKDGKTILEFEGIPIEVIPNDFTPRGLPYFPPRPLPNFPMKLSDDLID